jgi:hypothetical protein
MRLIAALVACVAAACGAQGRSPEAPAAGAALEIGIEDVVVPGEAIVARTSMDVLRGSPLARVLLEGFERQATRRVPALDRALTSSDRAPLDHADEILVTGRGLDSSSALLAVAVSYDEDVDWFEGFVRAFHPKKEQEGVLAGLERDAVLGVIVHDSQEAWGSELRAAVCAVRFTPRLVAFVAAPDPGECRVWASWVIAREGGDRMLVEKLGQAPEVGAGPPPLSIYVEGDAFSSLCCAPLGLSRLLGAVEEAWIGLDPGAPATLRLVATYENETMAMMDRNSMAGMLDTYAPVVGALLPGLGAALHGASLEVEGNSLVAGITVDAQTVESVADLLSTML